VNSLSSYFAIALLAGVWFRIFEGEIGKKEEE
jgi:hypothetical protein